MKNVLNFEMELIARNTIGDVWRGWGWISGEFSFADGVFNGYGKKEIARILKNKMKKRLGL